MNKPRQVVKAFAADKGLEMVTIAVAGTATDSFDVDIGGDNTLEPEDPEVEGNDDDNVTYLETTQLSNLAMQQRSVRSVGGSAPPARRSSGSTLGVSSKIESTPSKTASATKGHKRTLAKTSKKSTKKPDQPALAPLTQEQSATRAEQEKTQEAVRSIFYRQDKPGIKVIRQQCGLPALGTWDMDMSSHLDYMDKEWKNGMIASTGKQRRSFKETHIFTLLEVQELLESMAGDTQYSTEQREKYNQALVSLAKQSLRVPFPKPSKKAGGRDVLMQRLTYVMVDEQGNYTEQLTGDIHRREMMGLQTLHNRNAIYRGQVNGVSGAYCSFGEYVGEHHVAINNHL